VITPSDFDLPTKFKEFRPSQLQLAAKIASSTKYAFLLDGPTGTGKSLIAATAQRIYGKGIVYLCTTKQLQQQILDDFPYAKTLKGRNNYVCLKYPKLFPQVSAEECTHDEGNPCQHISECPYKVAKAEALSAPLAVLNAAYFLSESNYVGGFTKVGFLVVDEFDSIESQLMNFIELRITKRQLDRYHIPPPKFKTKADAWRDWAKETLSSLTPKLAALEAASESDQWGGVDFKTLREAKWLEKLVAKLKYFIREVDDTWVPYFGEDAWAFKPTWVARYANQVLWDHADKVLGMSATILNPRQVCLNTGLVSKTGRTYDYIQMKSPFPKENRPIYYEPHANVINKEMDKALPGLAAGVKQIIDKYPDDRILVHTVSYKVRDYLIRNLRSRRVITHSTSDRAAVLERFKASKEPLVLLSPSMDRGVDLPDNECRVVVIAKVPYPDLSDPQISKRVYGSKDGNEWYAHKTVSTIVQMTGRACRSITDHADSYILDSQFQKLFEEHKFMFPSWWREAVIM
jgi:Rad3-related DNA helicase